MRGDPKPLKQIDFFNDLKKYEKGAEWYVGHFERSRKCGAILGQNRSGQALDGSMLYFGSKVGVRCAVRYRPTRSPVLIYRPTERLYRGIGLGTVRYQ
eukprot:1952876-Rhodomonas_salina.1